MAAATSILNNSGTPDFLKKFTKLGALKNAIDEFYENAFAPEIVQMITFIESAETSSKLLATYLGISSDISGKTKTDLKTTSHVFQTSLLKIRQAFEEALRSVKLDQNVLIFIDGIDVRPSDISYPDYFECVRGLCEAIWTVNSDFFANIKDSKGRIRVVLLGRPDILLRTGLHNINTKLKDNSVFLDWSTAYKDYRTSQLFRVADRLLSSQQTPPPAKEGAAWDHYFPFHAENMKDPELANENGVNSFLAFLRFSYYRPRDINRMMATMQEFLRRRNKPAEYVSAADFDDPSFRDAHAEYLLGEIRDQLLFYYSQDEYNLFLQFFPHLKGKRRFNYQEFIDAYNEFIAECVGSSKALPQFFETANTFLQFLYDQNVICFKEVPEEGSKTTEPFFRFCFRERTLANIAPKVRAGVDYEIFYGLSKALNVGRTVRVPKSNPTRLIGTVTSINHQKGIGFIRGGDHHLDYYFKVADFDSNSGQRLRISLRVSFEPFVKYGKPRALAIKAAR